MDLINLPYIFTDIHLIALLKDLSHNFVLRNVEYNLQLTFNFKKFVSSTIVDPIDTIVEFSLLKKMLIRF